MSTEYMKPNCLATVVKKTSELKGLDLPKEIKIVDKYHYHILVIRTKVDIDNQEFTNIGTVVKSNINQYEKSKRKVGSFSINPKDKIYIIHDGAKQMKLDSTKKKTTIDE